MCDLKTAFFRFRRWAGKVLRPQTDAKTVFRYERAISGVSPTHFCKRAFVFGLSRNIAPVIPRLSQTP